MQSFQWEKKPGLVAESTDFARSKRSFATQSREVRSILHLQRMRAHRSAQPSLRGHADSLEAAPILEIGDLDRLVKD